MSVIRAIGIGCSTNVSIEDLLALVHANMRGFAQPAYLATVDRRAPIARVLAEALDLELVLFPAGVLAEIRSIATSSARAAAAVGTPSIAEAAALAAVGRDARLVIPRRTGRRCTFALAESL